MTARKQTKTWKAWGVFSPAGELLEPWMSRMDALWDAGYRRECERKAFPVRRVTISLSKPKRQARKVK